MKIICDWKNCNEIGSYRAPVEKDNSKKYRLLCLNHIKIFNKSDPASCLKAFKSNNFFGLLIFINILIVKIL